MLSLCLLIIVSLSNVMLHMLACPGYCKADVLCGYAGSSPHSECNTSSALAAASLETLLQQQLQAARTAQQQRTLEEIIYIWSLHNLSKGSMSLRTSLDTQQSSSCHQVCTSTVYRTAQPHAKPASMMQNACGSTCSVMPHRLHSMRADTAGTGSPCCVAGESCESAPAESSHVPSGSRCYCRHCRLHI